MSRGLGDVYKRQMLVRATGAFGTKARPPKTRIALLYEENFGYEGKYFAWKVAVFQLCEVALQVIAKFPMWLGYRTSAGAWTTTSSSQMRSSTPRAHRRRAASPRAAAPDATSSTLLLPIL